MIALFSDPIQKFKFTVMIAQLGGPLLSGYFEDIGGVNIEFAPIEYKAFNHNTGRPVSLFTPGRITHSNLTLKRVFTADMGFWIWYQMIVYGEFELARSTVSIIEYDRSSLPRVMWTLFNAWPTKFAGSSLSASDSSFQIEELTLVFERVEMLAM